MTADMEEDMFVIRALFLVALVIGFVLGVVVGLAA